MKRPDLHMHTTASDGIYTPTQLVHLAHKADITFCAVTDHDTVSGIAEAATAARERGMAFASGVELSAEGEAEVHILGYGVCPENPVLRRFFAGLEEERIQRFRKMAEKLLAQGLRIDPDAVIAQGGPSVGRRASGPGAYAGGLCAKRAGSLFTLFGTKLLCLRAPRTPGGDESHLVSASGGGNARVGAPGAAEMARRAFPAPSFRLARCGFAGPGGVPSRQRAAVCVV